MSQLAPAQTFDQHTALTLASGHQPGLWHPGIVAKYVALQQAHQQVRQQMQQQQPQQAHQQEPPPFSEPSTTCLQVQHDRPQHDRPQRESPVAHVQTLHVMVDQDTPAATAIALPTVDEQGRAGVHRLVLPGIDPAVPTACQPAVDANRLRERLLQAHKHLGDRLAVSIDRLLEVIAPTSRGQTGPDDANPPHRDQPNDPESQDPLHRGHDVEAHEHDLAGQWQTWSWRLLEPVADPPRQVVRASRLLDDASGRAVLDAMLHDARRCVGLYNDAAGQVPEAGVPALRVERDRLELPIWILAWGQARRRVFADLADSVPLLTDETGRPIEQADKTRLRDRTCRCRHDPSAPAAPADPAVLGASDPIPDSARYPTINPMINPVTDPAADPAAHWRRTSPWLLDGEPVRLAPRALLLTALMRSAHCQGFVHGTGGGVYDQITETWWQQWRCQKLAPAMVVTANLYLDFQLSLSAAMPLDRAVRRRHAGPHNVDRMLPLAGDDVAMIGRKSHVIGQLNDPRTPPPRRAELFSQLKQLNAQLRQTYPWLLPRLNQQVQIARAQAGSAAVLAKRDWPAALYPARQLKKLRQLGDPDTDA